MLANNKISLIEAKKLLTRIYETKFRIYDHFNPGKSPFADVLAHDFTDAVYTGLYSERAEQFAENKIYEIFGMSFDEFLNKPRHKVEILLRSAEKMLKKKSEILTGLGLK